MYNTIHKKTVNKKSIEPISWVKMNKTHLNIIVLKTKFLIHQTVNMYIIKLFSQGNQGKVGEIKCIM